MTDVATFRAALRAYMVAATGLPDESVIFAQQNGPRPAAPFATLLIGDLAPQSFDAIVYAPRDLSAEPSPPPNGSGMIHAIPYVATATLQCFGGGALARAEAARRHHLIASHRPALDTAPFAIWSTGNVTNLTGLLDKTFEERAAVDFRIAVTITVDDDPGLIETVESLSRADPRDGDPIEDLLRVES